MNHLRDIEECKDCVLYMSHLKMSKVISILAKEFSSGLDCGPLRLSVDLQTLFLHQPMTVSQCFLPE